MKQVTVIKIGGKVIDAPGQLTDTLAAIARTPGPKVLVHGGGALASATERQLGLTPNMVNGRRVTGREALEVAVMVYAGLVNKNIVAGLQARNCRALGLSGADGNVILAKKRPVGEIDYGFVGDIVRVNRAFLTRLLEDGLLPVFSAITHDGCGQLLNTNADTVATALAGALAGAFRVRLILAFEKPGVLDAGGHVLPQIDAAGFKRMAASGVVSEGMVPKLTNALEGLRNGIAEVILSSPAYLANPDTVHTKVIL